VFNINVVQKFNIQVKNICCNVDIIIVLLELYMVRVTTGLLSCKWHNLINIQCILHKNFIVEGMLSLQI